VTFNPDGPLGRVQDKFLVRLVRDRGYTARQMIFPLDLPEWRIELYLHELRREELESKALQHLIVRD
jgi:hypothetical protein